MHCSRPARCGVPAHCDSWIRAIRRRLGSIQGSILFSQTSSSTFLLGSTFLGRENEARIWRLGREDTGPWGRLASPQKGNLMVTSSLQQFSMGRIGTPTVCSCHLEGLEIDGWVLGNITVGL